MVGTQTDGHADQLLLRMSLSAVVSKTYIHVQTNRANAFELPTFGIDSEFKSRKLDRSIL